MNGSVKLQNVAEWHEVSYHREGDCDKFGMRFRRSAEPPDSAGRHCRLALLDVYATQR